MKKFKAILALLLVAALMLTLFAACSSSEEPATDNPPAGNTGDGNNGEIDYGDEEDTEMANIEFYFFDLRMTGQDHGERIEAAVNELTEPAINTHVNITYMVIGDWLTKVQLAIGGGEQVDVAALCAGSSVATMYTNTMLTDITDLMPEYAPETMALMEDYLGPYTYEGRLYGLPTYRNYCTNGYVIMRGDILDEIGMREQGENLSSWSDLEEIMAAVAEQYAGTGLYPISKGAAYTVITGNGAVSSDSGEFADYIRWDVLGDTLSMVRSDNDGNVSLYPAMPEYEAECALVKEWYDKGWVYPDSAITDTHGDELMKQGVAFATVQTSEVGIEAVKTDSIGYEVVCPIRYDGIISTSTLTSWGIGVPITTEEPEAACKFINMMYTNEDLMDLLIWGIEGEDYEIVEDQVQLVENGYYQADFLIGNNTLLTPLYGNGADFFDNVASINESTERSPYLGFALDTSDLDLVIGQITAVNDQYQQSLNCGEYTPENYQAYLDALEAAGVQDYLDAVQSQLNAWLETQQG